MLDHLQALIPLAGPGLLLGAALLSRLEPGRRPDRAKRALALASTGGVAAALLTVALLVARGPYPAASLPLADPGALIRIDPLSVTMLTMVSLLVLVVGRFSATYLEGDDRHGLFLGRLAATAASVEILLLANHLALFWIAWVLTSVCLHGLLLFYPDRPRAVVAARKKFVVARLGDLFLAGAFLLLYRQYGTGRMDEILASTHAASGPAVLTAVTVLLALTALLKSAQFPTHGWLTEVMETPTPVSALLHAGILNAGPFLILRFSPVLEHAPAGAWLLLIAGGFTAAFASVVLRTQPSVKVALAYSSAAHMGFSLFLCGLGVYAAAALHLVGHSFYKAHAFLSAGSAVDSAQAARVVVPPRRYRPGWAALALVLAVATCVTVATLFGVTPWTDPALLLIGMVVVAGLTQLIGAGLDAPRRPIVSVRAALLAAAVATAFFGFESLSHRVLASSLPAEGRTSAPGLLLGSVVVAAWMLIATLQITGWGRGTRLAHRLRVHVRHGFYVNALFDRLVDAPARTGTRPSTHGVQS